MREKMPTAPNISMLFITLHVGERQSLGLVLADDGSINRLGNGTVENTENDLYIGITSEPLFDRVIRKLPREIVEHLGKTYELPDRKGADCRLHLAFRFKTGNENGIEFIYGSDSQGPPAEVVSFAVEAIEATQPWYEAQKTMDRKDKKASWWKFWKR